MPIYQTWVSDLYTSQTSSSSSINQEYPVTIDTAATYANWTSSTSNYIDIPTQATNEIWSGYLNDGTGSITESFNSSRYQTRTVPAQRIQQTPEEQTESERRLAEYREHLRKVNRDSKLRQRLRAMADRRAKKQIEKNARDLLKAVLTEEEWRGYCLHGSVRIRGQHGIYDVGSGWSGMIFMLDHGGNPIHKLCCHPSFEYPTADRVAAVVLAIKADENGVLAKANRHFLSESDKRRIKAWRGHKHIKVATGHEYQGTGVQIEPIAEAV